MWEEKEEDKATGGANACGNGMPDIAFITVAWPAKWQYPQSL
jgi:hypothetical protein